MIIHAGLLMLFLLALIHEDMAHFEIDFAALAMVALNGAALNIHMGLPVLEMGIGALIWVMTAVLVRIVCGPAALGLGDIWLFAALGLIAGASAALAVVVGFVFCGVLTAWGYAHARGRPMARSLYPAAVPAGITILVLLMLRLALHVSGVDIIPSAFVLRDYEVAIAKLTLLAGPHLALLMALPAIVLMIKDRNGRDRQSRDVQIRERGAHHG